MRKYEETLKKHLKKNITLIHNVIMQDNKEEAESRYEEEKNVVCVTLSHHIVVILKVTNGKHMVSNHLIVKIGTIRQSGRSI